MKVMKVLRITRHEATTEQIEALQRALGGNIEIRTVSETLPSVAREAVERFDELANGLDVVEAVLPINLMEAILKFSEFTARGGTIIRAVMNREVDGNEVRFKFDHYEEVQKVEVVTRPL